MENAKDKLHEAKRNANVQLMNSMRLDGCGVIEGQQNLNDANREVIIAIDKAYGAVYLGKINSDIIGPAGLRKYNGEELTNFCCDFCVPVYSEELEKLIQQWGQEPDIKYINKILSIVLELEGVNLIWA